MELSQKTHPCHPLLTTTKSLTGYCISKDTFEYIESVWQRCALISNFDSATVKDVCRSFYDKAQDIRAENEVQKEQAQTLWELLHLVEFVLSSCIIYRSPPGSPVKLAVGVINRTYSVKAAIALLSGISADDYAWLVHEWNNVRSLPGHQDALKNTANVAMSEIYSGTMQIVRQMAKTKMRSVKLSDRKEWHLV